MPRLRTDAEKAKLGKSVDRTRGSIIFSCHLLFSNINFIFETLRSRRLYVHLPIRKRLRRARHNRLHVDTTVRALDEAEPEYQLSLNITNVEESFSHFVHSVT